MNDNYTCKKVKSLLYLYVNENLDVADMQFIKSHLEICPSCYKKYTIMQNLIKELKLSYQEFLSEALLQEKKTKFNIKEYEKFQSNLSAYFDNELNLNDSVTMKKYMIKFPNARKEIEQLYNLHKLIINTKNEIKKNTNENYSKNICKKLYGKSIYKHKNLHKKIAILTGITIIISSIFMTNNTTKTTLIQESKKIIKMILDSPKKINHELAIDLMQ